MAKNSSKSQAATLPPVEMSAEKPTIRKAVGHAVGHKMASASAEEVAESKFCIRDTSPAGLAAEFPFEPHLASVERFYPMAIGGALYIDEPQFDSELAQCERKREAMRKLGHRYLVLTKDMDLIEAKVQLEAARGVEHVA